MKVADLQVNKTVRYENPFQTVLKSAQTDIQKTVSLLIEKTIKPIAENTVKPLITKVVKPITDLKKENELWIYANYKKI